MNAFQQLIQKDQPVLVDFFATWCGPCQMLAPILKQVKESLGERITIIKIDVDKNPEIANRYQIRSVPTLLLFKNGNVVWKHSGVASKQQLAEIVKTVANN